MENWEIVRENEGLRKRAETIIENKLKEKNIVTAISIGLIEYWGIKCFTIPLIAGKFEKEKIEEKFRRTYNTLGIFEMPDNETLLTWFFDENLAINLRRIIGRPLKLKELFYEKQEEKKSFLQTFLDIFSGNDYSEESFDLTKKYDLKPLDYSEEFLNIMKNWEYWETTKEKKSRIVKAEAAIKNKLKDYNKITALAIEKDSARTSIYLKVGRFDKLNPNIWEHSYLTFIESYVFMMTSIFWNDEDNEEIILRISPGQPLNLSKLYNNKYIIG